MASVGEDRFLSLKLKHMEILEGNSYQLDDCHGYKKTHSFLVGLYWRRGAHADHVSTLICGPMLAPSVCSLVLGKM